ncbi:MAG: class I SAM-dependent DNA methyltransferase [Chloroflexi bacterium]|nr:class I SAM-dependent DNA methyltransferase [Chloroflexota bacterium]
MRKWTATTRTERAAAPEHFIDLCRMLGEKTPNEADPSGDFYAFEKGAAKSSGEDGFADVWLDGHFGWEYKGKRKDLNAAYVQLLNYHEALNQPPLLVVCDLDRFEVHTKWAGKESWIYRFRLADLVTDTPADLVNVAGAKPRNPKQLTSMQVLRALFQDPRILEPERTTDDITKEAAEIFGKLAEGLRQWKDPTTGERLVDDMRIARFITKLLFCLFATDVELLPKSAFSEVIAGNRNDPKAFQDRLRELFRVMDKGGTYGARTLPKFNGSLFSDDDVPEELLGGEVSLLERLDRLNWADVEPAIFGTLFERVLDPGTRAKLGAHYTSRSDIEVLAEPVLMSPLRREWKRVQEAALAAMEKTRLAGGKPETERERLRQAVEPFIEKIGATRVLDPACGSGNFLYVSLALLKSLEKEVIAFAGLHGVTLRPRVHPRQLYGIEVNPYAHELASVVIWIGYLQWKARNGIALDDEEPILQKLDNIHHMDAILTEDLAGEPEWPEAEVVIGNPPFLGGKRLRRELGDSYVDAMFRVWDGRVRREADLCCYWFEKARAQIEAGRLKRAGLLATQAIRGGANRGVLQRIKLSGDIFFAVDDREWVLDGAAVQVSMVGFDDGSETQRVLLEHYETREGEGSGQRRKVRYHERRPEGINADLTTRADATAAARLAENGGLSFMGDTKVGPFDIPEHMAREMLGEPNPHGRPNGDVVRPWANGLDVTRRPRGMWIIDFPPGTSLEEAAKYSGPFAHVEKWVKPERMRNARRAYADRWWIHAEPRPEMRRALASRPRYLATPNLTKYRFFVWLPNKVLPDHQLIVFARDDDYFFGVLHSRIHEVWALQQGTQLESRPRYTPTTCFETFPLPWPPGKEPWGDPLVEAISEAARELNELRERWLNPPAGDGVGLSESELKKRTLTNLYNERPAWLEHAHRKLDAAVRAAYGWPDGMDDQEILARLLELNHARAGGG